MTKEELTALGLSEEQTGKVLKQLEKSHVPKTVFDELKAENDTLKQSISDRDKQLETLKKSGGDSAELKKQIEELQKQNAEQIKAHAAELNRIKRENAVNTALTAAGAKNIKAVSALLDDSKIKLGDDGKLEGLDVQLKELQKTDGYLFAEKQQKQPTFKGFQPGASADGVPATDTSKMTYSELAAYMAANPDAKID